MASDRLTDRESRRALLVLLAAFSAWALWFIFRNSFVFDGTRYFVLKDDAMISMTYARNFANGLGLNWARQGQPVEGFTHPLWAMLMVPIHWLPISLAKTGLLVQLASLCLLGANLVAVRSLVVKHFGAGEHRHWLPAAVLTAAYYPLNYWALLGMETGLQALLTTLSVSLALSIAHDGSRRFTALFALLSAAALLRMDMLLMVAAVLGYIALVRAPKDWRSWAFGAAMFTALCGCYELFRWLYFGDWLPNTYYLKMTGVPASLRITRGALVTLDFLRPIALPFGFVLIGSLALGLTRSRRLLLPCGIVLGYLAYAIYVGGDAWRLEKVAGNRFVAFTFPLFFALSNALANELLAWLDRRRGASRALSTALLGALVLSFALVFNGFLAEGWRADAFQKRWREVVSVSPSGLAVDIRARVLAQTLALGKLLEPDAMVAVLWAGIPAYYSDYRMTDLLGYNDRHIAKGPSAIALSSEDPLAFVPGHNKWDAHYTLGTLRPDLVLQLWSMSDEHLRRVMTRHGYVEREYWVRRDSPYLRQP